MEPIFTIGHSTRPIEEFITILQSHRIQLLADVRTIPRSRHNPQFNSDILPDTLKHAGIGWLHMPELGGLRKPRADSRNTIWRNLSFRGYADYMETPEFEKALADLLKFSEEKRTAIMCAEAVPWRCHRSLVGDALVAAGREVFEITGINRKQPHRLTPFAQIENGQIHYGSDLLPPPNASIKL